VAIDGVDYRLRYIGMDSPETVDPDKPIQPMGPQAAAANETLVGGRNVVLEKDVSETDRFGRLLRYVWLAAPNGWVLVNAEMVRLGLARAISYPPDVKYDSLFASLEQSARQAQIGLWAPQSGYATPLPIAGGGQCDPSYPTVCIPPPPPDLDCADIAYRRFKVLPPDPHHFDGDHNGLGCERAESPDSTQQL
jgi:micrococcal nuclease